jgi:NAD(P)-dependent dehydrogenase (short-subunit alcohol dehydrogenase family)
MATFLITGANRGIGLEFATQLAAKGQTVLGTARRPDEATELSRVAHQVIAMDALDPESIGALGEHVKNRPIDVLINNAGVSSEGRSVETLEAAELQRVFQINTFAPMLVVRALLPNLRAGERKKVLSITSQLGSIANNTGGSSYAYRGSKAALNMLNRSLANELRGQGFTCIVAHPGWVRTDMGGPNAPLSPENSVRDLLALLERVGPDDTGKFFNHDGSTLPW